MLNGIQLKANPTSHQRLILSQWMGCAKTIWNAKCEDERYMTRFARKFFPIGTYAPIDQSFSQYKDKELSPWLYECPSQILRNSANNWYQTYWKFIKGECSKPKRKKRGPQGSIYLTREVFKFVQCSDGNVRLFIGTKKNNITHSGTELSKRGVLTSSLDTGQGAKHKSGSAKVLPAVGCELSKKKRKTSISIAV